MVAPLARRARRPPRRPSRCRRRRPTSARATTASGVALAIANRVELEVRGWSRGEIELTVEGEGRTSSTEDRDNRFVRGLEAALARRRGALPDGVGWRIDDAQPDPAGARPRVVGRGDRRPGCSPATRCSAAASSTPRPSCASRRRSRATPTTPPRRCSAGSSSSAGTPDGRRGDPVRRRRATCGRCCSSRSCACRPTRCARRCPRPVPLADAVANLGRGRHRGRRPGHRPVDLLAPADRRPAPRAVPRRGLPAAAAAGRGRARGRRARRLPVRRRLDDPRLRRLDGR